MQFQKKKILVAVKAYPNPSSKYVETVCCAGIDLSTNQWIRLYPIPFRLDPVILSIKPASQTTLFFQLQTSP